MADESARIATTVIQALECQAGLDTLPAAAALGRILTGVFKKTGLKFTQIGHGRMRDVFAIVVPNSDLDLGLVLKLGNKQATARDIALTLAYPEDRANIYAASDYGVVADRVSCIENLNDPRLQTEVFKARVVELEKRYIGVTVGDLGYIGERIVMIGSTTRVIKVDDLVKASASQQRRTV
jgi:hypothetical protein